MEEFVKGEVLVVPFPFSDLSDVKKRPVLVLAVPEGEDIIVCQITSRHRNDCTSIEIIQSDFEVGGLHMNSFIRPQRLFTMDKILVRYSAGKLCKSKIKEVENTLIRIFTS